MYLVELYQKLLEKASKQTRANNHQGYLGYRQRYCCLIYQHIMKGMQDSMNVIVKPLLRFPYMMIDNNN